MDAKEIREFYMRNVAGEIDGSLDEHNLCNALLGEIAAQLAEMNDRKRHASARFLQLSLDMWEHSRGQLFEQAMQTFPSAKFHEWCDEGRKLSI